MPANRLLFQDAEKARDSVTRTQQRQIANLYKKWAEDIGKKAEEYARQSTASAQVMARQMEELKSMVRKAGMITTQNVTNNIQMNMYTTANALIEANADWLQSLGFDSHGVSAAFGNVPMDIVQNLVTGNVYKGGWNLSKAIWGSNEQTMKDLYEVAAAGIAQNMPIYDIAKLMEQYVDPSSAKQWNLKAPDGKWIYKKQVDYNAQRLARTLVQHTYQQTFQAVTKDNPFIKDYIWDANGSRVCELCKERDGKHYPKDKLPLDHPNGMCVMIPNMDSMADISNQLADWVKSPDGKYPGIDKFAKKLGYKSSAAQPVKAKFTPEQEKYLGKYGFSPGNMPKEFDDWSHKVSYEQAAEILEAMGTSWSDPHPYQKLKQYYDKYLVTGTSAPVSGASGKAISSGAEFASKYGTSNGAKFNYWYSKLDPEAKAVAKSLKEQSGQTWQEWYEQNVYKPKSGAKNAKATQSKAAGAGQPQFGIDTSGWISRARKQTESHMLATEANNFAKMTSEQSEGIRRYTGSAYTKMNGYLRRRASGMSHKDAMEAVHMDDYRYQQILNAIDGLKTAASEEEFILCRGTDLGDLAGLMQGDFATNKLRLESMSARELNDMFAGHIGTYAGFTSTSSIWDRGFTGDVEVVMHAPVGTQGTSVMSISQFGTGEGEFLLNAGTKVRVVKVEKSDGHMDSNIRVYMEILGAG